MDSAVSYEYQVTLIYACLDDCTASRALGDLYGGQDGPNVDKWAQAIADFMYRNLISDLIQIPAYHEEHRAMAPKLFCEALLDSRRGGTSTEDHMFFWYGTEFYKTPQLESIAKRHGLHDWDFVDAPRNDAFINDIFAIYAAHGVPMSGAPLIYMPHGARPVAHTRLQPE